MSLPDAAMDSQVRHAVFLAVKEALNNAVKHSEATEIRFCVSCSDQELRVEVEDNGRGFDVEHAEGAGNGLRNLSRRLEAVGGWAEVSSVAGKGTVVRLVKRLNPTAANEK
jgi:signal transduction histidine kinase